MRWGGGKKGNKSWGNASAISFRKEQLSRRSGFGMWPVVPKTQWGLLNSKEAQRQSNQPTTSFVAAQGGNRPSGRKKKGTPALELLPSRLHVTIPANVDLFQRPWPKLAPKYADWGARLKKPRKKRGSAKSQKPARGTAKDLKASYFRGLGNENRDKPVQRKKNEKRKRKKKKKESS